LIIGQANVTDDITDAEAAAFNPLRGVASYTKEESNAAFTQDGGCW
jgi:hypothetical protein